MVALLDEAPATAPVDIHPGDLVLMGDLCVDEYTDHGHCGILDANGDVDNDPTLELYAKAAVAQAEAG